MNIKVLLHDGRIVSIHGSEPRHVTAIHILMKVAPEDVLFAEDAEGNVMVIKAGAIKNILDAFGKPMLKRRDDTLLTIRGSDKEPSGEDED